MLWPIAGLWSRPALCYAYYMKHSLILIFLIASPALADVTYPDGRTVECYCTDRNHERIELGETICLQVDGRMFMAQCQMSLNVPMWREVEEGCLSSGLRSPDQSVQPLAIHSKI